MSRARQAAQWVQAAPCRTQSEAARLHGITQPAVAAELRRMGRSRPSPQVAQERAECAALAEACGAAQVADLIRARAGGAA